MIHTIPITPITDCVSELNLSLFLRRLQLAHGVRHTPRKATAEPLLQHSARCTLYKSYTTYNVRNNLCAAEQFRSETWYIVHWAILMRLRNMWQCDNMCIKRTIPNIILMLCAILTKQNVHCTLQKGKFCIEPYIEGFLPSSTYVQGIPCLDGANTSTPAQSDPCIFAHTGQTPFQYPSTILCLNWMIKLVDLVKNYKTKTCPNEY